jgi:membrane protein DedA with SNARE-associated domain
LEPLFAWTENILRHGSEQAELWIKQYGYHAVVPTLLIDPAGVPWAWIFLILFAEAAHLNVPAMLFYGFLVLSAFDHLMYWLGLKGGRPMIAKIAQRFPKVAEAMQTSEGALRGRGIWGVTFGRYLPIVGRWVGVGAGLANVPFLRFAFFDALGVLLTVIGFGLPAHLVGQQIVDEPWFPQAIAVTFVFSTIVTLLFIVWQAARARKMRLAAAVQQPVSENQ